MDTSARCREIKRCLQHINVEVELVKKKKNSGVTNVYSRYSLKYTIPHSPCPAMVKIRSTELSYQHRDPDHHRNINQLLLSHASHAPLCQILSNFVDKFSSSSVDNERTTGKKPMEEAILSHMMLPMNVCRFLTVQSLRQFIVRKLIFKVNYGCRTIIV